MYVSHTYAIVYTRFFLLYDIFIVYEYDNIIIYYIVIPTIAQLNNNNNNDVRGTACVCVCVSPRPRCCGARTCAHSVCTREICTVYTNFFFLFLKKKKKKNEKKKMIFCTTNFSLT